MFSTPMVKAILKGDKTQTRRIVKQQPEQHHTAMCPATVLDGSGKFGYLYHAIDTKDNLFVKCPYGQKDDVLYVRETWLPFDKSHIVDGQKYAYKADSTADSESEEIRQDYIKAGYNYRWRSSLHMPKEAARLWLQIETVRIERLQDISQDDAFEEGVDWLKCPIRMDLPGSFYDYKAGYKDLWGSINGADSWNENPYVWVVTFKKIDKPNLEENA